MEADVWLGSNVTVLGGVTIGSGSVVAASALVTKSVAPYSICKGIPAKVTGNRKEEA
ncbi:acetyltransferase [Desulfocapsa sp. AH-315-G09]|nr:acetyltransferase [Desulfocapsa sp.]MBN4065384.1 acetyltransferase [Desulfocapsa sp. AH-315-G09]